MTGAAATDAELPAAAEDYVPTPANARFRREWKDRWGESSERIAWYAFDWANSAYAGVMLPMFVPLLLSGCAQRAAKGGFGDVIKPCVGACVNDTCTLPEDVLVCQTCKTGEGFFFYDPNLSLNQSTPLGPLPRMTVSFFGGEVEAFTFTTLTLSLSVALQAFSFITFGAIGDYATYRKKCLLVTSSVGCLATILFIAVVDGAWYNMAASLTIISNVCFGLSVIFYNSYLPILAGNHPEVVSAPPHLRAVIFDEITNYMSTTGFVAGYVASFFVSIVAIAMSLGLPKTNDLHLRVILCFGGLWWGGWSIWTFLKLKVYAGKPVVAGDWLITKGWLATGQTLKQAAACPQTFKFLVAYFFYSDSYSTVVTVGVLLMRDMMCMQSFALGLILIEVMVLAVIGNMGALRIQRRFKVQPKYMIFACLCGYMFLSAFSLLGLIDGSPVGLKSIPEAYFFGALHGLMIGAVQSYSRTMFCDLLIPGKEAEFFALFEITDKGSSWLGPLVVSQIYNVSRSYHLGFVYLLVMTIAPAFLLLSVDHQKGMAEAQAMGKDSLLLGQNDAFEDIPPDTKGIGVDVELAGPVVVVSAEADAGGEKGLSPS